MINHNNKAPAKLQFHVENAIEEYFANLDGELPINIYQMVIREVEIPLINIVLKHANGNQRKAANLLGVSRTTLRKKILEYKLNKESQNNL